MTPCWWTAARPQYSFVQPAPLRRHAQVEVLRQRARPRPAPQGVERGQAGELGVPAHADAAQATTPLLEDGGEDDELHVLHAGQQRAEPVVDPHPHLHGADLRRGERPARLGDRVGVQPSVGIDHADDHRARVAAGEALADDGEGVVEGLALAPAGIGKDAPQDLRTRVADGLDDVPGPVVAAVVDDHDVQPGVVDVQQALDGGRNDLGLVEAGHEDDDAYAGVESGRPSVRRAAGRASGDDEKGQGVAECHDDHSQRADAGDAIDQEEDVHAFPGVRS